MMIAISEKQTCSRCILDTHDDPQIIFDEKGVCNHCRGYDEAVRGSLFQGEEGKKKLTEVFNRIREDGKNKPYDCILGVSGGVDSTFLALQLKKAGLRPLCIHFDNGWNSELAVMNIENLVNKLGFDLFTYVVDWQEFRDLQISYFKANVTDLEVPSDHGFWSMLMREAHRRKIKYLISGHNLVTEYVLPKSMIWSKWDLGNLKAIHRKFGTRKLKTFPTLGFVRNALWSRNGKIETVKPLNYMHYDKAEAKKVIQDELGWRDYGGKHYESIFTRFFQGYILPEKCGIDKRKAHISNLIVSGQITREEGLAMLAEPRYDPAQLKIDREFVLKKLGFTEEWFTQYMKTPPTPHLAYKSYTNRQNVWFDKFTRTFRPFVRFLKRLAGRPVVEAKA